MGKKNWTGIFKYLKKDQREVISDKTRRDRHDGSLDPSLHPRPGMQKPTAQEASASLRILCFPLDHFTDKKCFHPECFFYTSEIQGPSKFPFKHLHDFKGVEFMEIINPEKGIFYYYGTNTLGILKPVQFFLSHQVILAWSISRFAIVRYDWNVE